MQRYIRQMRFALLTCSAASALAATAAQAQTAPATPAGSRPAAPVPAPDTATATTSPQQAPSKSQEQAPPATDGQGNGAPASVAPANAAAAATTTPNDGDIVVTALRSDQTLQRTPAAVTVVGGDLLERQQIAEVTGLQNVLTGTRFSKSYTSTRIVIRGIGSLLDFYWIPELTATNFNGVYLPRYAINGAVFDLENVQLLPGPQGVLYGRSAGGGALLLNSNRPTNKVEAAGSFQYGNYDLYRTEGMANIPITDDLAVRGAFSLSKRNGYQSGGADSDDSFSVRLSALYKPTDALSVFLWLMHYKQTGNPQQFAYLPYQVPNNPWYVAPNDPLTGITNFGAFYNYKYTVAGYEVAYDFGSVSLDYTGSYLRQTEISLTKVAGNDRPTDNAQNQYTQHLQLSGKTGDLSWILGGDYLHADSRYDVRFGIHQFGTIFPTINQTSWSGFGQATYSITPALRVVGGTRYSSDHLDLNGTGIACFAACSYPPISFDKTWHHVDGKGGVELDLTPRVLLYANVQTGYAPGTLNTYTNTITLNKEILPQTLLAYTAGFKSRLFGDVLTFNVEGYYYDYKKLVIQAFNAQVGSNSLFNIPKATSYGAQVNTVLRPWHGGSFTADVAYTHARYGEYQTSPRAPNLHGLQAAFAPDWTATLAYDHNFDLTSGARVDARIASYISSSYWATFDHTGTRQGSYTNTDASITYHSPDDRWFAGGWIKNIENADIGTALGAVSSTRFVGAAFLEPPRTYGLTVGFKF